MERHQNALRPLIHDFGIEKVIEILTVLLSGWIFQSELKANIAFPDIFRTTPSRDVQHAESGNDAVRSDAEALDNVLSPNEAEERIDIHRDEDKDGDRADSKSFKQSVGSVD